jgi:hypothetical protein
VLKPNSEPAGSVVEVIASNDDAFERHVATTSCHQFLKAGSVPHGNVAGEIADQVTVDLDRDRVRVVGVLGLWDEHCDYAVSDPLSNCASADCP